jgi:TPR repeat protein
VTQKQPLEPREPQSDRARGQAQRSGAQCYQCVVELSSSSTEPELPVCLDGPRAADRLASSRWRNGVSNTITDGGRSRCGSEALWRRTMAPRVATGACLALAGQPRAKRGGVQGDGWVQDYAEAVKWYRRAAAQGDSDAQIALGMMYKFGKGVTQDDVRAHMWFNLAAVQDSSRAVWWRDMVAERMTAAQIAEAQKLAREWKPKSER